MSIFKFKIGHTKVALSCLLICLISFVSISCSKTGISGQVIDPAGKALEGVTIKVDKSSFSTLTDAEGDYIIDYAPGSFKLIFSKDGFTTQKLELNIANKTLFPAESIKMYPIPKKKGVYLLDGNQLVALRPYTIRKSEWKRANKNYTVYNVKFDDYSDIPTIESETVNIIDTSPESIKFARLGGDGQIENYSSEWMDIKYLYNGFIDDKRQKIGEEQILLRTINVEPGFYALIEVYTAMMSGRFHPDKDKKAHVFYIPLPKKDEQEVMNLLNEFAGITKGNITLTKELAKKLFNYDYDKSGGDAAFNKLKKEMTEVAITDIGKPIPQQNNEVYIQVKFIDKNKNQSETSIKVIKEKDVWYIDL